MTIKPNYLLAFLKTFLLVFLFVAIISGLVPYFEGKVVQVGEVLLPAVLGGSFLGMAVAVFFTPREITWDDGTVKIRALFPGSGDFEWQQLAAWSPSGRGTFLIKFEGKQAFQIAPVGFNSEDWKAFRSFLEENFPDKKTLVWFGVRPIRFGKKMMIDTIP